jgi:hypothetical protein
MDHHTKVPDESSASSDVLPPNDHNGIDLEKQDTQTQSIHDSERGTSSARARVTRTQSITRRATYKGRFTHPLSHVKTSDAEIVDFEGLDDPYRPINWPFRKKVVTTLLYGSFVELLLFIVEESERYLTNFLTR